MSNRPVKRKKKVVEITQEDFDVEWTPPPRTGRDRLIQFGVLFLIIAFLLPAVTCAVTPDPPAEQQNPVAAQQNEVDMQIKRLAEELAGKPNDPSVLANLGYYTNQKAESVPAIDEESKTQRMTLLATSEKYLKDALAADPDYFFATSELIKNQLLQQKNEEADELIEGALAKLEPMLSSEDEKELNDAKGKKIELLGISARGDLMAGKSESALKKMDEVIELKPGEPNSYLMRSNVHKQMQNKEAARKDLEMMVEISQKTGNQQMAQIGQLLIEQLDKPPEFEVVKTEETEITPSPTP